MSSCRSGHRTPAARAVVRLLGLASLGAAWAPCGAVSGELRLQNGQVSVTQNIIRGHRVPTIVNGKAQLYLEVTITLGLDAAGVPASAKVTAIRTPVVTTTAIAEGTYKSGTATCVVTNTAVAGGRTQSAFSCKVGKAVSVMSVVSGAVTATHPFYAGLHAFNEDTRKDSATYLWGIVGNNAQNLNTCYFIQGFPVGIKTDGKTLVASSFYGKTGGFYCSAIFTKQ